MNDFENKLRSLRPGIMPETLRDRLAKPVAAKLPAGAPPKVIPVSFGRFFPAAAAAVALFVAGYGIFKWWPPQPADAIPNAAPSIAFVSEKQHQVTGMRPVATFRDASNRPWRLMEVSWKERDTLVSASQPTMVQVEENHTALVPVAVRFD